MKEPKCKGDGKVVIGPVRISFAHLFKPHVIDGGKPEDAKYEVTALIPKEETATVEAVRKAIAEAKASGVSSKWGGKVPNAYKECIKDGDEIDYDGYADHWVIGARSGKRVPVVDARKNAITDEEDVYSGCYCRLSLGFFPYKSAGNVGVACGLNAVQKLADGERLSGGGNAADDFDEEEEYFDDEDL